MECIVVLSNLLPVKRYNFYLRKIVLQEMRGKSFLRVNWFEMSDLFSSLLIFTIIKTILSTFIFLQYISLSNVNLFSRLLFLWYVLRIVEIRVVWRRGSCLIFLKSQKVTNWKKSTVHKNAKMNTFTACFSKIAGFFPTLTKVGGDVIM
jgi:hypothetical protein